MRNSNNWYNFICILFLSITFISCSAKKYLSPQSESERRLLDDARTVLQNVEKLLSEANKLTIQNIKVYLYKNHFTAQASRNMKSIYLPALGNLSTFYENDRKSYLDIMCSDDESCKVKLSRYQSLYYLLHELYHVVHADRYCQDGEFMVKDPNGRSRIMSYTEELNAESIVVKYLSIYEPELLEEYNSLFVTILKEKRVNMDEAEMKKKWDGFQVTDFRDINNSKLFFYVQAVEGIGDNSLEELLFET